MGLSWLFGGSKKKFSMVNLRGPGTFSIEIVGESHYQSALENICAGHTPGGHEKLIEATLIHEDDNPYHSEAIRVEISGQIVGHLSRENTRRYREWMREKGHPKATATCLAKIVGGWQDEFRKASFGVRIDLPSDYHFGASDVAQSIDGDKNDSHGSDVLTFEVSMPKRNEIQQCQIGEDLKLWMPPKDDKKIYIFRSGTFLGQGRLGFVPDQYFKIVASHLKKELPYEAVITQLSPNTCKIKCKLVSQEEFDLMLKQERQDFEAEIKRKYTPRKGFDFFIELPKENNLKEGQLLFLDKEPFDNHPEYPGAIRLRLVNEKGKVVAYNWGQHDKVTRILRAHNSGYRVVVKIQSADFSSDYKVAGIAYVRADAEVDFQKKKVD